MLAPGALNERPGGTRNFDELPTRLKLVPR
jgi:hypothetical protein